jgi:glycosyltransferase involved in cell wall biosynthesis
MQITQLGVETFADDLPITDHNRTNQRIRAYSPTPALSQLQSAPEMRLIRRGSLGIHTLIDESISLRPSRGWCRGGTISWWFQEMVGPLRRQDPRAPSANTLLGPPMKLIIQIPCLNEEATLPQTIADLPRSVPGIDEVELLVVDDGSTDRTVEVAREHGVQHIVRLTNNKGLAAGFQAGLDACLKLGADVVVNTDADNQYRGADVAKLVAPIVAGEADMVVGDRRVSDIDHFSAGKKRLQRLGSWVVRRVSGTRITDATSGFRAYNREAALQLLVVDDFTYTLESLVQAGKMLVAVDEVEVGTNPKTRESRLFTSTGAYVRRNAPAILRIYARYEPLRAFSLAGLVVLLLAFLAWLPFLLDWILNGDSTGHVQSLILGAVLFIAAVQLFALGVIGDLLAGQRVMTQRVFERVRRVELALGVEPSHYEPGSKPE